MPKRVAECIGVGLAMLGARGPSRLGVAGQVTVVVWQTHSLILDSW